MVICGQEPMEKVRSSRKSLSVELSFAEKARAYPAEAVMEFQGPYCRGRSQSESRLEAVDQPERWLENPVNCHPAMDTVQG